MTVLFENNANVNIEIDASLGVEVQASVPQSPIPLRELTKSTKKRENVVTINK